MSTTDTWLETLQQQGAVFDSGRIRSFGDEPGELQGCDNQTILVPLPHLALLRASGSDTESFLQGQTSNDVRQVDATHHQLSSYSTPKGRMLALFTLFMRDGDYYIQLPQEMADAIQKRLTMFVMRSDVKLENVSQELPCFGISGPQAESLLVTSLGVVPAVAGESISVDGITVLRHDGAARFSCLAPAEKLMSLWQTLEQTARPVGAGCWELLEIRAGIPSVEEGTVEAFVPQMVNLQLINGVNFKKGCYPGQEVVARMQYLGKLKRRMYHAHIAAEVPPTPGTSLFAPDSSSGQGAGKVVRAARSPQGGVELLAVAEISSAEQQALFLENDTGPQLTLLDLPYTFEQDEGKAS